MTQPTARQSTTSNYGRFLLAVLLILLLATFLRFHKLEAQSFWNDEGNSARLSERTIALIIEGTASDIHPPLYYLMLRGWRELVGESEFALRTLSAFFGIGVVALTFTLTCQVQTFLFSDESKKQKSYLLPSLAALLTAVNPALIYYSQEARMYEMLAFLALLSTVLLIHWLKSGGGLWRKTALFYILTLAAGLYTHYFFPAIILTHGLLLINPLHRIPANISALGRRIGGWLALVVTAVVLYLPWLPIFIRQAGGRPTSRPPLFEFLADAGQFLAFGSTVNLESTPWPLYILVGLLLISLLPLRRRWSMYQSVSLKALAVPVLFMWVAGTTGPPFYKFMLAAIPPLLLLLAHGFDRISQFAATSQHRALYFVALSVMGLFLVANYTSLQNLYDNPAYARADYRAIAAQITAETSPQSAAESAVILNAANQWEVFTYYYQDVDRVYPLPHGFPDPARIEAELTTLTGKYNRLYVLFWGEAERDPERMVERFLDANAFKTGEEWVGDVRLVTYAVPDEPPGEIETAVGAQFGPAIILEGYTLQPETIHPGDILQIALYWQTAEPLDTRYKVFLHLIGPDGQRWSQRDSEPGGNLAPTTTWEPNQTIQDNHGLLIPAEAPPGDYTLLLGLYDINDPTARLTIETADGGGDMFPIILSIRN